MALMSNGGAGTCLKALLFACILGSSAARASEIAVVQLRSRAGKLFSAVSIQGEIVAGDTKKLAAALSRSQVMIRIDSPGGDVVEAIRMGEIVRALRMPVTIYRGELCASACFFIWLSGSNRLASGSERSKVFGRVGLHRPYLRRPENSDSSLENQARVIRSVSAYLDRQLVPRRLIDVMMNRPSNDIYWLTEEDLAELGEVPNELEELYIAKCGYNRNDDEKLTDARLIGAVSEVEALEAKIKRVDECRVELDFAATTRALEKLRAGWLPVSPLR